MTSPSAMEQSRELCLANPQPFASNHCGRPIVCLARLRSVESALGPKKQEAARRDGIGDYTMLSPTNYSYAVNYVLSS